jgi:mandelate racemase
MTIRSVRARGIDLRLDRPVETAAGVMRTAPLVLVDVETGDGTVGHGYLRTYTATALDPLVRLVENVGELLVGTAADPGAVAATLARHFRLVGPQGLTGMAAAGVDMALWDAVAKARGVPLVTALGGEPRPIPAYASLRSMRPESAAAEAEELLARGFTGLKLKVAAGAELDAIAAVRAVAGDVDLMVDYNQSLTVDAALERVRVLDGEGLAWIEEPTRGDDFAGHARIAAAARTPIQLGESWWGTYDMEKSIAAGASDHVTLDAMKIGGVTGWLRGAELAQAAGLPVSSHTFPEVSVHLLGVTPTCHRLEYLDHAAPILADPIRIVDGHALPSDRPGNGLEWRL